MQHTSRQVVPLLVDDAKRTLDVKIALSHGAIHSCPQRALDDYIGAECAEDANNFQNWEYFYMERAWETS